jgi:hypothetical protein
MKAGNPFRTFALPLAFVCCAVFAQAKTDYTLNGDQVHFRVPPEWTAIMEKSDGDPQAVIFQVPDATAQGTEETASVTIKTRMLKDGVDFNGFVQDEFERSKGQAGYENDTSNKDATIHRYFVVRSKTRYLVRDHYQQNGTVAVQLRCQRPLLDATPKDWSDRFDASCASVIASMKR